MYAHVAFLHDLPEIRFKCSRKCRIENDLHWVMDVAFKDDQSRLRKGRGAENMAVVRYFAVNLIRQAPEPVPAKPLKPQRMPTKPKRASLKLRRKIAGWNSSYLSNALGALSR